MRVIFKFLLVYVSFSVINSQNISISDAVDNDSLTWITGTESPWIGQDSVYYYDGDAARSGSDVYNVSSWIQTEVNGPAVISFYWQIHALTPHVIKTIKFYVDTLEMVTCRSHKQWVREVVAIDTGSHNLKWDFINGVSAYFAGFLDKVTLTEGSLIVIKSPNGGDRLSHRDLYKIEWVYTADTGSKVNIELYQEDTLKHTIATNTENDGSYIWYVPTYLSAGSNYRIKITSVSLTSVYGISDSTFTIYDSHFTAFGGYLLLDAEDDYTQAEDLLITDAGDGFCNNFTVEAWIKIPSTSIHDRLYKHNIVQKKESFEVFLLYFTDIIWESLPPLYIPTPVTFYYNGLGILYFSENQMHEFHRLEGYRYGFTRKGWHHYAFVIDKDKSLISTYIDGKILWTDTTTIDYNDNLAQFGYHLDGELDELRISNFARYIESTFTLNYSPFQCDENTLAIWHFDEWEGETVFHDICGVDNRLIGFNGAQTMGVPNVTTIQTVTNIPSGYKIFQNYPNPFNPSTKISFDLPRRSQVKITIYNILGKTVQTLFESYCKAGSHLVEFEASHLPSGVYFYHFSAGHFQETKKMLLIK